MIMLLKYSMILNLNHMSIQLNYFVVSILIIIVFSCSTEKEINLKEIDTTSFSLYTDKVSSLFELEDSVNIAGNQILDRIDAIEVFDKKIYLLNRYSENAGLYVYSENGDFQNKIGTKGAGPGEYQTPYDFIISNNAIQILDLNKIHIYDLKGEYQSTISHQISAVRFEKIKDNYLFYCGGNTDGRIVLADDQANRINSFLPIQSLHGHSSFQGLQMVDDEILIQFNLHNKIYKFSDSNISDYLVLTNGSDEDFNQETVDQAERIGEIVKQYPDKNFLSSFFIEGSWFQYFVLKKGSMQFPIIRNKKTGIGKKIDILNVKNDINSEDYFPYVIDVQDDMLLSYKVVDDMENNAIFTIYFLRVKEF